MMGVLCRDMMGVFVLFSSGSFFYIPKFGAGEEKIYMYIHISMDAYRHAPNTWLWGCRHSSVL